MLISAQFIDNIWSHTNDDETILGPSDSHTDLVRISKKAKVVPEPAICGLVALDHGS